jgi:dolichol-phosphate mannosyltransferase
LEQETDFAVVLPTFNERANVVEVISKLESALEGLSYEIIFVDDDSPDGTAELVRSIARLDKRIRLIHRVGRRGLASACVEGIMASSANHIAVMDADMQHDERVLPEMLRRLKEESLDIVIGTRNAQGGSMGEFAQHRVWISRIGQKISNSVCRCQVSDPMSGFFLVSHDFFTSVVHQLQSGGFKILVDMLASSPRPVRLGEVGYTFRSRRHGKSKLDINTAVEYLFLIVNKLTSGFIPIRFAVFALVGMTGLAAHLICLTILIEGFHVPFWISQTIATFVAMTENFFLNNVITYRDRSLRGGYLLWGLLTFWLACSFGAYANVVFARELLRSGVAWYVAGMAGTVLSSVWNYSVSNLFTWKMPRKLGSGASIDRLEDDGDV